MNRISKCALAICFLFVIFSVAHADNVSKENTKVDTGRNGVLKDQILIGQTTAATGPMSVSNHEMNIGAKVVFDDVNASGGIYGRMIRMRILDDQYSTSKALENVRDLIENEKVFMLFGCGGTPVNMAIAPLVLAAQIPALSPVTGADIFHGPAYPYYFHTRASYGTEVDKIVEHLLTIGHKRIAVIHADNSFGEAVLANIEQAAKRRDASIVGAVTLKDGLGEVEKAIPRMLQYSPTAIITATGGNGIEFIKLYRKNIKTPFFTISVAGAPSVINALGDSAIGLSVSQIVPNPYSDASPLVAQYRKKMKSAGNTVISFASLEGYINARILVEALRRSGPDLSREGLMRVLHSPKPIDLNGYQVAFGPNSRTGSRFVQMSMFGRAGRFIQ